MTTVLDADAGYLVIINTFSVDPARSEELLRVLVEGTERVGRCRGFISANWHVATDGRQVTNYAQWRSQADVDAMLAEPAVKDDLRKAGAIATRVEPISYRLRGTYGPTA